VNHSVYTDESFYNIISLLQCVLFGAAHFDDHDDSNILTG
jgi:hypothetical protein